MSVTRTAAAPSTRARRRPWRQRIAARADAERRILGGRERRILARRFREIEADELSRRDAAAERALAALAMMRTLVTGVDVQPRAPRCGRAEVTLSCAGGSRLVLRDVPLEQIVPVTDACRDTTLRVCGGARPGALVVVVLESGRATLQLHGSRLTVEPVPASD